MLCFFALAFFVRRAKPPTQSTATGNTQAHRAGFLRGEIIKIARCFRIFKATFYPKEAPISIITRCFMIFKAAFYLTEAPIIIIARCFMIFKASFYLKEAAIIIIA